jgi:peptidoglycan hydrolase-like protein with peptidoglycan-binding domain
MMRRRTLFTGGALALAAGAVAIAALLWNQQASPAAVPAAVPAATAEIVRGNLRDTRTVTGMLGYGELSALRPSLAADAAMITWLAPVGSTIERGDPLYRLDGQPAILLYGAVPQHRTLRFDADGDTPIWVELEQARTALEAAELTLRLEEERLADAEARTADADSRLADALSGAPLLPEFIELTGAVSAAQAKLERVRKLSAAELTPSVEVAAAEAGLAAARAGLDAAIRALRRDLSAAGLDAVTARVAVADARIRRDDLRAALDALVARTSDDADVAQLAANLAALGYDGPLAAQVRAWQQAAGLPVTGIVGPSEMIVSPGPVHIAAHTAGIGETLTASSADRGSILDYSSTQKLVTVPLAVADQGLAAVGRAVTVTLPDDTEVPGTITEIGSVVTDGAIEVTVAVADQAALGGLEVASVDVGFVSDSRSDVLSVPVAALLARPEGGFALEVVADRTSTLVPVDTGLFAAGRVEVTGEGIAEGLRVGVPG